MAHVRRRPARPVFPGEAAARARRTKWTASLQISHPIKSVQQGLEEPLLVIGQRIRGPVVVPVQSPSSPSKQKSTKGLFAISTLMQLHGVGEKV